jgi:hypothetical protein
VGTHAERTTTRKRSLRGTERPSGVLNGLQSDVEPGGEPAFTWKVAFPVSSPGGKMGRASCRNAVLGEPVLLLSDTTEGHFRRAIYHLV